MDYKHSVTFGSLKSIKEGIQTNLTSVQYLSTLDYMLGKALSILFQSSRPYITCWAAKVVSQQTLRPSTKFSRNERGTLPTQLFNLIVTEDAQHFEEMNFNRGILFGIIRVFQDTVNSYDLVHSMRAKSFIPETTLRVETQLRLGMSLDYNLSAVSREVAFWEERAQWFKSLIVQKYVRMALNHAQATYKELAHSYPLDDIVQIYLAFTAKAIDRCDARQGVLTTFITSWFKSAKAEAAKMALDAYHQSYEELMESGATVQVVDPNSDFEAVQHLAAVAKHHDPEGIVRAVRQIPELVPSHQRTILQLFTKEE